MYKWWLIFRYWDKKGRRKALELPFDNCNSREEAINNADAFWESLPSRDKDNCIELTVMFTDDIGWDKPDYMHTQDELILYGELANDVADDEPYDIPSERKDAIIRNLISWINEVANEKLEDIAYNYADMTEEEADYYGARGE